MRDFNMTDYAVVSVALDRSARECEARAAIELRKGRSVAAQLDRDTAEKLWVALEKIEACRTDYIDRLETAA